MTHTILIVDEEAPPRKTLAEILRKQGFHVLEADDGATAIGLLRAERADLIFSDCKPSGLGKEEFLTQLRNLAHLADVPVIAIANYGASHAAIEAVRLGAHDFVTKPFTPDEIAVTVQLALDHAALHSELSRLQEQTGGHGNGNGAGEPALSDVDFLALPFHQSVAELEKRLILKALKDAGGNKSEASHRLQINRRLLYNKIEEHDIEG